MKKSLRKILLLICTLTPNLWADSPEVLPQVPDADLQQIRNALPATVEVKPAQPRKVLVMWLCKGFYHESIPWVNEAIKLMGESTGAYKAHFTNDPSQFTLDKLKQYDAIIFNNTTVLEKTENETMRTAIKSYVEKGGGVVGIHGATDNFYKWPELAEMMGGCFDGHPWGGGGTWRIKNSEPSHPLNKVLGGIGFDITDELYQMRAPYSRDSVRVLLAVDHRAAQNQLNDLPGIKRQDNDFALSWVRQFGEGRVYYSGFGHNKPITWNGNILQTWLGGIQFAVGDFQIPTKSMPEITAEVLINDLKSPSFGLMAKRELALRLEPLVKAEHIPSLSALLLEPEISHFVRIIVQNTPCQESEEALMGALEKGAVELKSGMISSLGELKSKRSLALIGKYVDHAEEKMAISALRSLAKIGGNEALGFIQGAKSNSLSLKKEREIAMLECVYTLLNEGNSVALGLFEQMAKSSPYLHTRVAAYKGMLKTQPAQALQILTTMIKDKDANLQLAGAAMIGELPVEALKNFVAEINSFGETVQLAILEIIKNSKDPQFGPAVRQFLNSANPRLEMAAIRALATVGQVSDVEILLQKSLKDRDQEKAVVSTLSSMKGLEVDELLIDIIRKETSEALVAMEALSQRSNSEVVIQLLVEKLKSQNSAIVNKAGLALTKIGGVMDLPLILKLVKDDPKHYAAKVVLKIISTSKAKDLDKGLEILKQCIEVLPEDGQKVEVVKALAAYRSQATILLLTKLEENPALKSESIATRQKVCSPKLDSSHGKHLLKNLFDKDPNNRWTTNTSMRKGMWLKIDRFLPAPLESITLENTDPNINNFPPAYEVYLSDDGLDWGKPVIKGKGNKVTNIPLGGKSAAFIRIELTEGKGNHWSICDLKINGRSIVEE